MSESRISKRTNKSFEIAPEIQRWITGRTGTRSLGDDVAPIGWLQVIRMKRGKMELNHWHKVRERKVSRLDANDCLNIVTAADDILEGGGCNERLRETRREQTTC